nr:uncharacterized protein CTRU02_12172 [Colletotrichum truncatum]KAF6784961.1 hypothetical protein CTRU02_12172 [Colletotrichum truncatum]
MLNSPPPGPSGLRKYDMSDTLRSRHSLPRWYPFVFQAYRPSGRSLSLCEWGFWRTFARAAPCPATTAPASSR